MAGIRDDWQLSCLGTRERLQHMLAWGMWTDCSFEVYDEEVPVIIPAHKLLLAMTSPVFEAMFFGRMAEKSCPIPIPDMKPHVFKQVIQFIYVEKADITSIENACDLWYGAQKYILPKLRATCTSYILSQLSCANALYVYDMGLMCNEDTIIESALCTIRSETRGVLKSTSFFESSLETILIMLSLDSLNIRSELDLFEAVENYALVHGKPDLKRNTPFIKPELPCKKSKMSDEASNTAANDKLLGQEENCDLNKETLNEENAKERPEKPSIRLAIEKIRFLTLSPQQFAEGPARSPLLSESEAFAVLMNILSSTSDVPMPSGFSTCRVPRNYIVLDPAWGAAGAPCQSEATFMFAVHSFATRRYSVTSPCVRLPHCGWAVRLVPHYYNSTAGEMRQYMGFFLVWHARGEGGEDEVGEAWAAWAEVTATLTVKTHQPDGSDISIRFIHTFTQDQEIRAFPNFMTWEDATNIRNGYLKKNTMYIHVHVVANVGLAQ